MLLLVLTLLPLALATNIPTGIPKGWIFAGTPDKEPFNFVIALKQNTAQLHDLVMSLSEPSSSSYGQYLTKEEISQLTKPKDPSAVVSWLSAQGIPASSFHLYEYSWLIEVRTTTEQASELLGLPISKFLHKGTGAIVLRSLEKYHLPQHIAEHIEFIAGVNNFPRLDKLVVHKPLVRSSIVGDVPETTPQFIRKLYNITVPPTQSQNLQAVISFLGQYFSPDDLQLFQNQFNLPQIPIEKIQGPNEPNQPGTEASLDVQYLTGIPGNIRTWVYSTPGTRPGDNEPFLKWIMELESEQETPYVFSISYQDLEYTVDPDYASRVCDEIAKLSAHGRTFVTGSGDWGVGCRDSDHCNIFTSDFPSSCPYIVSLGATRISSSSAEVGVDFSSGGFSYFFRQPTYQTSVVKKFLSQPNLPPTRFFNVSGRAFPDLSTIGTNFQVFQQGSVIPVGGTSASTPTFASMISMLNSLRLSKSLPTMGFINPFLYQANAFGAYKDITNGDPQDAGCCENSFATVPGWDPYTGLGTPNFGVLAELALNPSFFNFPEKDQ